jgi:hypothetical protein
MRRVLLSGILALLSGGYAVEELLGDDPPPPVGVTCEELGRRPAEKSAATLTGCRVDLEPLVRGASTGAARRPLPDVLFLPLTLEEKPGALAVAWLRAEDEQLNAMLEELLRVGIAQPGRVRELMLSNQATVDRWLTPAELTGTLAFTERKLIEPAAGPGYVLVLDPRGPPLRFVGLGLSAVCLLSGGYFGYLLWKEVSRSEEPSLEPQPTGWSVPSPPVAAEQPDPRDSEPFGP